MQQNFNIFVTVSCAKLSKNAKNYPGFYSKIRGIFACSKIVFFCLFQASPNRAFYPIRYVVDYDTGNRSCSQCCHNTDGNIRCSPNQRGIVSNKHTVRQIYLIGLPDWKISFLVSAARFAVPDKIFGLAPFLDFIDRCTLTALAASATGSARAVSPNELRSPRS